jgi:site-specific DNA recombinase
MIAAIYARLSKDKNVDDEAKSTHRQVEHARKYAARKGWTVADAHVYVDNGISGAEFKARPGFVRLMNALKPRAAFDVLIMSESSRLGREQFETGFAIKQLSQAGVRCFSYLDDREVALDTATEKFMMSAATFGAELEREKTRQRVTDTMARKARAGHVTGGRVFGYDNVKIPGPDGKPSHTERIINDPEAAVVRRIFEWSASGVGFTRIAKALNDESALCPRPFLGRPAGWAPTSVRAILLRPLYRGEVVYNMTRKKDDWGQRKTTDRPEQEWIRTTVPALRVVPDALWQAAQARLAGIRSQLGTVRGGRSAACRRRDIDSTYLLAGFARCATCGGALCVMNHTMYGCMAHHKRGARVCPNALRLPMERVNDAVLAELMPLLRPRFVMALVDEVLAQLSPRARATDIQKARAALPTVERAIANLTNAIAFGGDLESLVGELRQREMRRRDLLAVIAAGATSGGAPDRKMIERTVSADLDHWRAVLATKGVAGGRQFLREKLERPMMFTADGRTYRFEGALDHGRMISGMVGDPALQPLWCARLDSNQRPPA